jgi:hypothetical protein
MALTKVTSGLIEDATIINADVHATAGIVQSKLATLSITDANIADDAISGNKISGGTIESALTGNVTGNVTGSSGSCTGNAATTTEATNITAVANNSTNETTYPVFVDGATGTQGLETDTGLSYNPSTGLLSTNHVVCSGTGVLVIPVGTTAQRPGLAPIGGIRFNSTTTRFEGYNGSAWVTIDTLYN